MYLPTRLPETETRADPFSLDSLIAWLRTKNPEETYCYTASGLCLIGQYFAHLGYEKVSLDDASWDAKGVPDTPLPDFFDEVAVDTPWTFGAALSRATAIRGGVR